MSMIISGDLSLNSSGIVILALDTGSPVHYEAITSDLDYIERLAYNYNRYLNLFKSFRDIRYISYESQTKQMRFQYSAGNILDIAENVGVWKKAIWDSLSYFNEPPMILAIPAQDIKIFATGNSKAEKEDMINAVNGHHIKSIRRDIPEHSVNDVADAYHLAKMTRELIQQGDYRKYLEKDYQINHEIHDM